MDNIDGITTEYMLHSFLHLKVLVKPELSIHVPMGYQNISLSLLFINARYINIYIVVFF